jgi:cell volume regulation protein A
LVDSISSALIIAALIIINGFAANFFFKKTGIPDMLFLIFIGVIFGPIFGIFDPVTVKNFAPFIAALALAYILFDGGMGLNIKHVLSNSPKAIILAVIGFVFSVIAVCVFMVFVFNVPFVYGLLFGSMLGGSSSIVVISIASRIKLSDEGGAILIMESAITDILCIVISLSLLDIIVTGQANVWNVGFDIVGKLFIGLGIGLAIGFIWLFALRKIARLPFSYMLTIGVILLGYAVSETLGGSGALSALVFGLILGNEKDLLQLFRRYSYNDESIELAVSKGLRRFQREIAFLIRTFFFVFLGLIFSPTSFSLLLAGVGLSFILLLTRFGAIWITTAKTSLKRERPIMAFILTRGLAAAVLATLPAQFNLPYSDLFVNIAVLIIVSTAIIATVGTFVLARRQ